MLSREACERRVYRLATLLTGDPKQATRVITAVVGAQPDLRTLDSAHLDRLTVLRSREVKLARFSDHDVPQEIADGLSLLSRQQREAWIFHFVYRMMPRDMARAMDCSVSAIRTHLETAEALMRKTLGRTQTSAGKLMLEYSMSLDVPAFYREALSRRLLWRRMRRIALAAIVATGLVGAGLWLWQSGIIQALTEAPAPAE